MSRSVKIGKPDAPKKGNWPEDVGTKMVRETSWDVRIYQGVNAKPKRQWLAELAKEEVYLARFATRGHVLPVYLVLTAPSREELDVKIAEFLEDQYRKRLAKVELSKQKAARARNRGA